MPLRLDQVDLVTEDEAAIDLFASVPERLPSCKSGGIERAPQEGFESIAALMGRERTHLDQFVSQGGEEPQVCGWLGWPVTAGRLPL